MSDEQIKTCFYHFYQNFGSIYIYCVCFEKKVKKCSSRISNFFTDKTVKNDKVIKKTLILLWFQALALV